MKGKIKSQKSLTDPPLSQELSFKNKAQIWWVPAIAIYSISSSNSSFMGPENDDD